MEPIRPSSISIPERPRRRRGAFLSLILLLTSAGVSSADTVSIRRPDVADSTAPTVYSDVKVTNIFEGRIVFTTPTGNSVDKELASVVAMTIDDEPQFNQAQQDYAANRLNQAIDEFNQTIQNTDKPWLKAYCQPMLTDAANKSGRFDLAVQGFIYLVLNQPAAAAGIHLTVPSAGSPYLDGAAKSLSDASNATGISPQQQAALLSLLLDVDRTRNDTAGIDDVASRLTKIAGDAGNPTADLALADAKITEARDAVFRKDFDQAAAIVTGNGNLFVDVRHQADALFILAAAREGQAQSKDNPGDWQDAAIAFMRVAADFKDAPGAPHVANSLLNTARILEAHLNQPAKALRIYQSVQTEFPQTTAAEEAASQIARLQAAGVQPD
jgi:tetratricopeptide (TPR) repeat protein